MTRAPHSEWFPRPRTQADIRVLGPSGELEPEQLLALLGSARAEEWRDKVGVSSPDDGSAKSTTRLLHVDGWVFKTDTRAADDRAEAVVAGLGPLLRLAARVELWHPHKRWFLLRDDRGWWPVSVCPRLDTLRSVSEWSTFARLWAQALSLALQRSQGDGLGLDLNPSNFGVERSCEVWYLDDETYAALELADVAEAIVGRIPEWPELPLARWSGLGRLLRGLLEPVLGGRHDWRRLSACVRDVVLAARWHPARAALLDGIQDGEPRVGARSSVAVDFAAARRIGLIADVHGNLPALEAVLADAARERVDGWLFLGDAVGYGPQPNECVERLAALPNLLAVRGNHDHMACFGVDLQANGMARRAMAYTRARLNEAACRWLHALPIEQAGDDWLAVHGAPIDPQRFYAYVYGMSCRRNLEHLCETPRRWCFHGHTHVPMIYRRTATAEAETLRPGNRTRALLRGAEAMLINPGSVGQPRDGDARAAYAIWDRNVGCLEFRRVVYELAPVLAAIRAVGLPDDLALRLELGR